MKLRASLLSVTAALAALSLGLGGLAPAAAAPGSSSSASDPAAEAVPETAPPAPAAARAVSAADSAADQPLGAFYAAPSQLPQAPASQLKHESSPFYLGPARAVRLGEAQSRIMYTTTDSDGAIVPVTGSFLESGSPWRGPGDRPLITYAVGTQGPHTYMDRLDQGHAVLDAARAVRDAGLGGTSAQTPVGIVGYSQGGGAAASAGELAASYAPDLRVQAVAAGAPPADLSQVAAKIDNGLYNGFLMYTLSGLVESEGISPAPFLTPRGVQLYTETIGECTTSAIAPTSLARTSSLTASGRSVTELNRTEPFLSILERQRLGAAAAPSAPVLIVHSVSDDVTDPPHILSFLKARFDGRTPVSTCGRG